MAYIVLIGKHTFNLKSITVEPVMFMYMFCSYTQFLTFQALIYHKTCVVQYNSTFCNILKHDTNETFKIEGDTVQKDTSTWILYSNLAFGIPSLIMVSLFYGPWGDKYGRKIPVIMPLIGAMLAGVSNIVNSIYMTAPIGYLLIGNLLNGLMGGYIAAIMAVYSYIAHAATTNNRTIKMAILEGMVLLSMTLGTATSGVMLDHTSYQFAFSFVTGIVGVTLIYTIVWVDNIVPERDDLKIGSQNKCYSLFLESIRDTFMCVYERRNSKNFLFLAVIFTIICFNMLVTIGEIDVSLIYTRGEPFHWSQTKLGLYVGTSKFLGGLFMLTLLPLLKWEAHVRDTTLAICGMTSKITGLVLVGIGKTTAILFIGAVCGCLQGFTAAAMRSMSSSMVEVNQQAKLFSLIAIFENLCSLCATSLFNTVYNATLDVYRGFCFLMAAGIVSISLLLAIFLHIRQAGVTKYETLQEDLTVEVDTETPQIKIDEDT